MWLLGKSNAFEKEHLVKKKIWFNEEYINLKLSIL